MKSRCFTLRYSDGERCRRTETDVFGQIFPAKVPASSWSSHFWTCGGEKERGNLQSNERWGNNTRHETAPWCGGVFGVTYPADGAEALVDPPVPLAGSGVLVSGSQSFVTSVVICRKHREEDEMSVRERTSRISGLTFPFSSIKPEVALGRHVAISSSSSYFCCERRNKMVDVTLHHHPEERVAHYF